MNHRADELASSAAEFLEKRANPLVEEWIEWLQTRVRTRTIEALPKRALRDHIPPVVESLAAYIKTPVEAARADMLDHLELHALVRLDQGYDLQELLAEFDGLATLVCDDVDSHLAASDADATDMLEVSHRLAAGLRSIGFVTAALYRRAEEAHRRELARRLQEFGRAIEHEIRSPLHTILIAADLLQTEEIAASAEARSQHVSAQKNAVTRISQLLESLHTLALAEGAQAEGTRGALRSILESCLQEMSPTANENGVDVRVEGEVPNLEVETLPAQLAIINLIGNAIRYRDPEKEERWVRITTAPHGDIEDTGACLIKIEDNGIGIPEEFQSRVFRRGFRAHPDVADGTGLGLAITRDVLVERGGKIELESQVGEGTTVTVILRALELVNQTARDRLSPDSMLRRGVREQASLEDPDDDRLVDDD